jgi:hypothetical protein
MSPKDLRGGLPSAATDARLFLVCVPHRTIKSAWVIKVKLVVTSSC